MALVGRGSKGGAGGEADEGREGGEGMRQNTIHLVLEKNFDKFLRQQKTLILLIRNCRGLLSPLQKVEKLQTIRGQFKVKILLNSCL